MPEFDERQGSKIDRGFIYHEVLRTNPDITALRQRRDGVTTLFEQNQAALQTDAAAELASFRLAEVEPDLRYYPVRLAHSGELYTDDLSNNPHLPRRPEVPGALRLTAGDLHAAAQWGMLPELDTSKKRSPKAVQAARSLINFVEYQTALRRLYFEKHIYDDQIWDYLSEVNRGMLRTNAVADIVKRCPVHAVTPAEVQAYAERPTVLAERICFTFLARLGGRATPALSVFQPRAGVDRFKNVDIIARIEDSQQPSLVGLDVTLTNKAEELWNKTQRMRKPDMSIRHMSTTDPSSGAALEMYRDVVMWPLQVLPEEIKLQWQAQRGHTTMTPEYVIPPAYRLKLSRSMMKRVCRPSGECVYNDDDIVKTYTQLYGTNNQID